MGTALATAYQPPAVFTPTADMDNCHFDRNLFDRYMADKYGDSRYLIDWKTVTDKKTTQKNEENYLGKFKDWIIKNSIMQPTTDNVRLYFKDLADRGLSAGTQSQYAREVKAFFHWTAVRGLYPDIADSLHGAKVRHDVHKRDALERDAVPEIADTIDRTTEAGRRDYAMYLVFISCGTRCIELSRADVGDIREDGGKVYLAIQRKGHEEKDGTVELIPEVLDALRDYLKSRQPKPTPDSPLFASTSNNSRGERIAATTIGSIMKRVLVNAGYNSRRLTAHSLRHTSITGCYNATGDPVKAQYHAGHADVSTTSIYIHEQERKERTDEQDTYNYFFRTDEENTKREQAMKLIDELPDDKLDTVLDILKAIH